MDATALPLVATCVCLVAVALWLKSQASKERTPAVAAATPVVTSADTSADTSVAAAAAETTKFVVAASPECAQDDGDALAGGAHTEERDIAPTSASTAEVPTAAAATALPTTSMSSPTMDDFDMDSLLEETMREQGSALSAPAPAPPAPAPPAPAPPAPAPAPRASSSAPRTGAAGGATTGSASWVNALSVLPPRMRLEWQQTISADVAVQAAEANTDASALFSRMYQACASVSGGATNSPLLTYLRLAHTAGATGAAAAPSPASSPPCDANSKPDTADLLAIAIKRACERTGVNLFAAVKKLTAGGVSEAAAPDRGTSVAAASTNELQTLAAYLRSQKLDVAYAQLLSRKLAAKVQGSAQLRSEASHDGAGFDEAFCGLAPWLDGSITKRADAAWTACVSARAAATPTTPTASGSLDDALLEDMLDDLMASM